MNGMLKQRKRDVTMKKLTILANTLETYGGGERWVLESATRLKRHFKITIINPISGDDEKRATMKEIQLWYDLNGIDVVNIQCRGVKTNIPGLGGFIMMHPSNDSKKLLESIIKNTDVFYSVSSNPALLLSCIRLTKRYKKKTILGLHNPELLRYSSKSDTLSRKVSIKAYNAVQKKLMDYIGNVHVQTESQLETLSASGYKGKVFYIPHYLYVKQKAIKPVKKRSFIVLWVGRLVVQQKGLDMLEKIIGNSIKKEDKIIFHIIGSGDDGSSIIKRLVSKYPKNVKWFGFVTPKDLEKEYSGASLFIIPSRYETPGLTLLEAQSHGLPAVAFDVPGPIDIMKEKLQGVRIKPFDINEFSSAILKYYEKYETGRDAYNKLEIVIQKIIAKRYTEDKFVKSFIKMVEND
jgi:glycosyltransferase involved in cell wall biosynthesis